MKERLIRVGSRSKIFIFLSGKPRGNYQGNFRKYSLPPIDNSKVFCPRPDCNWRLFPSQVENHCTNFHHINKTVSVFTYTELRYFLRSKYLELKLIGILFKAIYKRQPNFEEIVRRRQTNFEHQRNSRGKSNPALVN